MTPKHSIKYFCTRCDSMCYSYEQGLCCQCDQPWITEVIDEEKYPEYWITCKVTISFPDYPQTYEEAYHDLDPYEIKNEKKI